MQIHGITFTNRTKTFSDAQCPDANNAMFALFASMCAMYGVNRYVRSVEYSTNDCTFVIDADETIAFTDAEGCIALSADATLDQYELFGVVGHRGSLDEGIEGSRYDA